MLARSIELVLSLERHVDFFLDDGGRPEDLDQAVAQSVEEQA